MLYGRAHNVEHQARLGALTASNRGPVWHTADGLWQIAQDKRQKTKGNDANSRELRRNADLRESEERYTPNAIRHTPRTASSVERSALSHVVLVHFTAEGCDDIVFTAYRPDALDDVLTEAMVGSGVASKDGVGAVWFDVGNFETPWQSGEEVILIIETYIKGVPSFATIDFTLDATVDIQKLDRVTLEALPEPAVVNNRSSWIASENANVIGYSVYDGDRRLNQHIIENNEYASSGNVSIRVIVRGGYETVYASGGAQGMKDGLPIQYACSVYPNPSVRDVHVMYALPERASVRAVVYDVAGRQVQRLVSAVREPGFYTTVWAGTDCQGRKVAAGIYFMRITAGAFTAQEKILLVR
jgi:hypothetical protein